VLAGCSGREKVASTATKRAKRRGTEGSLRQRGEETDRRPGGEPFSRTGGKSGPLLSLRRSLWKPGSLTPSRTCKSRREGGQLLRRRSPYLLRNGTLSTQNDDLRESSSESSESWVLQHHPNGSSRSRKKKETDAAMKAIAS